MPKKAPRALPSRIEEELALQLDALEIPYSRGKSGRGAKFLTGMHCWLCHPKTPNPFCVVCRGKFRLPAYEVDFHLTALTQTGVEVQGGIWQKKSGHNTGRGISRDIHKMQLALMMGWRILPVSSEDVKSGLAAKLIQKLHDNHE